MGDATRFCWRCAAALTSVPPVTCRACGQAHYNNPRPAAEAVVIRDGQVLLIRRAHEPWRDCWDLPGGFLEAGEDPRTATERELLEETGLNGRATALLGTWPDRYGPPEPDGMQITTLNLAYRVELDPVDQDLDLGGEALEAAWFPLLAPPPNLAFPEHAHRVLVTAFR